MCCTAAANPESWTDASPVRRAAVFPPEDKAAGLCGAGVAAIHQRRARAAVRTGGSGDIGSPLRREQDWCSYCRCWLQYGLPMWFMRPSCVSNKIDRCVLLLRYVCTHPSRAHHASRGGCTYNPSEPVSTWIPGADNLKLPPAFPAFRLFVL